MTEQIFSCSLRPPNKGHISILSWRKKIKITLARLLHYRLKPMNDCLCDICSDLMYMLVDSEPLQTADPLSLELGKKTAYLRKIHHSLDLKSI